MAVLQEFKCPCCNGAISFDSNLQKMKCPYCGSSFEVEALKAYSEELNSQMQDDMSWDTAAGGQWQPGEEDGLRVYTCNSCGGEVVADETTGATHCPFCDNPVVMTGQFAGDLKPDLVIPFQLDKKAAIAALHNHCKGKRLLPKIFKDQNQIKEVKGLYVPFWLFDADADARIRYKATQVSRWSDRDYIYTEVRHYSVTRAGSIGFVNVPVDGSSKMDDALMESIEPYSIEDAVDFQTAYLAGYLADRYDVDSEASVQRANQRIRTSTERSFAATVHGYSTVVPVSSNIQLHNSRARYALYPVWVLNTQWNGQSFRFVVNGQTGKIAGNLPMDKKAYWKWLAAIFGIASAAAFGLAYLLWLL